MVLFAFSISSIYAEPLPSLSPELSNNTANTGQRAQGLTGISLLEYQVFAQTFEEEPFEVRIARLERSVFGEVQTGDINTRQSQLNKILVQETPAELNKESFSTIPHQAQSENNSIQDATEYPIVVAIERKVFGRDFIHDNLNRRLNRIEKRVYNKTYSNLALVDRVDKLLERYPEIQKSASIKSNPENSVLSKLPESSAKFVGDRDTYAKLTALETTLLGRTHSEELITERLDRLENRAFGYKSSGYSISTRINRLLEGYETGYNNAPEENKRSIQSRGETIPRPQPSRNATGPSGSTAIAQNSYRYSPELVQMLPPDLRAQYYRSSPAIQNQTIQNQGTVILPNSVNSGVYSSNPRYSGFQTFSNNGTQSGSQTMTYQNTYSTPFGTSTQRSTTQVFQTPGSTLTVTKEHLPSSPIYTGSPVVIQQLAQLESKVYGQINTTDIPAERLRKLELVLTGRSYPQFSDAERLNNLTKVYQYQSLSRLLNQGQQNQNSNGININIPLNP